MALQTILGAGGSIGGELAKELTNYTQHIRLVSRNPGRVNFNDELFPADITDASLLDKAIAGSAIVYLTVGFEYNIKVWRKVWPSLMRNTIASCKKHKAKLVFFDNVYMYDREYLQHMTEETPIAPSSKKGEIRAEVAKLLLDADKKGEVTALIARSADFMGPKNSIPVEVAYKNFAQRKSPNWFADADKIHSFTFTPDAAKAMALLGNTPEAYHQVWHLPTDSSPLTGKDWIALFAQEMEANPAYKIRVLPNWLLGLLGIFMPIMREFREMNYQYDRDYFFDSSKFEKTFKMRPTPPAQSVKRTIQMLESE